MDISTSTFEILDVELENNSVLYHFTQTGEQSFGWIWWFE